ncbi:MAG: GRAS family protein [Saprospiraceae bacterium]|nr:GRAS family protein [Saprospiraceae bacterium]HMW38412.1 hypothetical protein [Saprospiraceae bacterium]HMX87308.1 hypothetical protein [Saprospiraceae bacterium]HMZ39135.1 hypothetical protein [Saprospiraceae bacterium]HNA63308.1 hypothetical protein [Saprospiraceae bacterium]
MITVQSRLEEISQILKQQDLKADTNIQALTQLYQACRSNAVSNSEDLLSSLILKALIRRTHAEAISGNIYDNTTDTPQIELFNILIEKFPFVKFSQQLVNDAIISLLSQSETATILDIGIGQGTQILGILSRLPRDSRLRRLIIIGVEPFPEALSICTRRIEEISAHSNIDIQFYPIEAFIEKLDFEFVRNLCQGNLIVNASLALHHIQTDIQRVKVLQAVKNLRPVGLYLIEPNVDHMDPDLSTRVRNSFHHFHALFQVIDRLEIKDQDKNSLKLFFGREIEDILGKQEADRYERHDLATRWISHLEHCGFKNKSAMLDLPVRNSYGVEMNCTNEGFFGFTYDTETVLAVIYAS